VLALLSDVVLGTTSAGASAPNSHFSLYLFFLNKFSLYLWQTRNIASKRRKSIGFVHGGMKMVEESNNALKQGEVPGGDS
jgi:hypothetical protein